MKILIVGFAKIKYMPYLNIYLENLNREKNEIHLVYWNRDEQWEDVTSVEGVELHEFKCYQEDEVSKASKIKNFLRFKKYVNTILKNDFDFVIVLQSVTAVLMYNLLITKRFKGNYIYDYRDCTYEKNKFYKHLIEKLVKNSRATFVSSRGFKKYLPESDKIKFVHNILSEDFKISETMDLQKTFSDKIRIGFWGFLREEQVNLEIIKKISKDQRFELHYYGREQKTACNLKDYVSKNQIKNVFFHGEYIPEEKYEFLKNTDIIHNVYCEKRMLLATSNKYYDGIIFKTPQICMKDSYMGALVEKRKVGCAISPYDKNFTQGIYDTFARMNIQKFEQGCYDEKLKIFSENEKIAKIIKDIS